MSPACDVGARDASWLALGWIPVQGGGGGWHGLGQAWGTDTQWGVPDHRALLSSTVHTAELLHPRAWGLQPWAGQSGTGVGALESVLQLGGESQGIWGHWEGVWDQGAVWGGGQDAPLGWARLP